jgi:hypothetical protein
MGGGCVGVDAARRSSGVVVAPALEADLDFPFTSADVGSIDAASAPASAVAAPSALFPVGAGAAAAPASACESLAWLVSRGATGAG